MNSYLFIGIALIFAVSCNAFHSSVPRTVRGKSGVRSLSAVLDVMAGISLANKLNSAPKMPIADLSRSSMVVAATETKMGMYKEYTIDKVDDSSLDSVKRNYKTAEETDDSKDKYWTVLAVLLFGSFAIPMVQYYWYVAEED